MHSLIDCTFLAFVVWGYWGSNMQISNQYRSLHTRHLTSIRRGNFISTWLWNSHITVKYGRVRANMNVKMLVLKKNMKFYWLYNRWPSFVRFHTTPRENSHIIVTCVCRRRWNIVCFSNRHFQNGWVYW